jgi:hypothetical protein
MPSTLVFHELRGEELVQKRTRFFKEKKTIQKQFELLASLKKQNIKEYTDKEWYSMHPHEKPKVKLVIQHIPLEMRELPPKMGNRRS